MFVSDSDIVCYLENREARGSLTLKGKAETPEFKTLMKTLERRGEIYDSVNPDSYLRAFKLRINRDRKTKSIEEHMMRQTFKEEKRNKAAHKIVFRDTLFDVDPKTGLYQLDKPNYGLLGLSEIATDT